ANTIVISRADKFGLAQLHQLRGRVGRSHHQAYAYLMVPDLQSLTRAAQQRLDAIQQMEELGSGFYLAMHDLEIRGAGEVLGENQSGNMLEVGFQMYNDMLAEAVAALKAGREPDLLRPLDAVTDINLHAPALLPDDYCGDVHTRLSFYKKLATARTLAQLDHLREELADRFGKLPPPALMLFEVHRLRVLSEPFGIVKVDAAPGVVQIVFKPHAPVDPAAVLRLVQTQPEVRLACNDKLLIERECAEPLQRAQLVRDIIGRLGQPTTPALEAAT
ncbi:MAG: TRCF domain-containing protein, partial [Burkholderiaceae bacterium]